MTPVRVLVVALLFPPYHTGAGRRLLGYAADLSLRGVEFSVLSATPGPARIRAAGVTPDWQGVPLGGLLPGETRGGVAVHRVRLPDDGARRVRTAIFAAATLREIRARRPDVVFLLEHSVEFLPVLGLCRALGVATAVGYTLVLGPGPAAWRRPLERLLWPLPFNLADGIVANGAVMASSLVELGVHRPVTVIPNGVPLAQFHPCPNAAARAALRGALGLDPERRSVLFAGAITPRKGPDLALEAFARVAETFPDTDLLLAGPWLDAPGPAPSEFSEGIRRQVAALGGRVRVLGQSSQMPELLRVSDVLMLASSREGVPNVMLEAMASGCPVVTTRFVGLSGLGETNEPPSEGLRVTERAAEPLARGLADLLGSPEGAARQAKVARAWVSQAHDRGRTLDAYAGFFRSLARERRGVRAP